MSIPFPGTAVRGSQTGKPIMALLDLLGRTWSLGILWQLSQGEASFRELQQRCEQISPSLLNNRIKELRHLDLVDRNELGYCLTAQGRQLFVILEPLGGWSVNWARQLKANKEAQ